MADGKGCKCAAYDESECACDADWTPQELIDARAEIACLRDALDEQTDRAEWNYECVTRCEEKVIQRDAEIDRLRLTDAEREAVAVAMHRCDGPEFRILRGLLSRTGDCPAPDNAADRDSGPTGSV
jgi:hypothetical protein